MDGLRDFEFRGVATGSGRSREFNETGVVPGVAGVPAGEAGDFCQCGPDVVGAHLAKPLFGVPVVRLEAVVNAMPIGGFARDERLGHVMAL